MKGGKRDRRLVRSDRPFLHQSKVKRQMLPLGISSFAHQPASRKRFCAFLAFDLSLSMPDAGGLPANGEAWPIGRG
jgi:hypothetical protein